MRSWGIVLVILLTCGALRAAGPDAKTLFEQGKIAFALGRFADAADLFEKAFEKKPDPAMLFNAAQAHRLAGNKKKALILYQNFTRLFGQQENGAEVERRIVELKAEIAADEAAHPTPPPAPAPVVPAPAPAPAVAAPATTPATSAALVASAPPPKKSIAHRGWFWGVVVAGAIVVGGAVALGLVFGSSHQDPAITLGTVKAN